MLFNDAGHRFESGADLARGFVTGFMWSSEAADAVTVREETLSSVYRAAHAARFGWPSSLGDRLMQESRALGFARARGPALPDDDLAYSREVLAPHLDSSRSSVVFAGLYGDEAARTVGYLPMGLSPWAGLALARADGLRQVLAPEQALA
jgi:hypothetical protein